MTRFESRAARARELAGRYPASKDALLFFAAISEFQVRIEHPLESALQDLLALLRRIAPQPLRDLKPAPEELTLDPGSLACFHARVLLEALGSDCENAGCQPFVGVLRPQGDGTAVAMQCAFCLKETPVRRTTCPNCGESSEDRIAFYSAPEFPQIKTQTCDSCQIYFHLIDLGRDPQAIPEADEIAAQPLDIWALDQGYGKLFPNLVGL